MENQQLIIENVFINTPMSDSKIDNSKLDNIPDNVQVLSIFTCNNDNEEISEKNNINYSFLNKFLNLEFLYISSLGKDGLITSINQGKVKLPETLKVLALSESDYYTDLNFDFLKDLPNLKAIYLYKSYNDFNSIYENNVEKIINLVNPKKTKILRKSNFIENSSEISLEVAEMIFGDKLKFSFRHN